MGHARLPRLGGGALRHADRHLPLLPGQGRGRPDAGRGAVAGPGRVYHGLPPRQQRHRPSWRRGGCERGNQAGFLRWWLATIVLGAAFLVGTAYEWHELIYRHHLTISRNLFGTTYYTLVGLHALHVTAGVIVMLIVLGLALAPPGDERQPGRGRAGLLVLALRGRRLGGRVHGGLPGGTVSPGFATRVRGETHGKRRANDGHNPRPRPRRIPSRCPGRRPRPGAGPRHHPAGRRRGPRHGLSRRRRRGRRCGPEHLDRPVAARPRACPRAPGRAGTRPSP